MLGTFGFTVLLPLTALIIGTSVLGAEIDDGRSSTCWPRRCAGPSVILTKFAVATVLTMMFAAVPELIAALIAGGGNTPATFGTRSRRTRLPAPVDHQRPASSPSACSSARWSAR